MRYLIIIFLLFCNILSFSQEKKVIGSFVKLQPVPKRAVNDFGKFLTSSERDSLEDELLSYWDGTGNSIVFISLDSLTDQKTKKRYNIEEAALLYFNTWGIGDSIDNKGVLIMVSRLPRRVRIEIGRGLESVISDSTIKTIIDEKLVPNFKQGLFYKGVKEAVSDLVYRLKSEPTRKKPPRNWDGLY